MSITEDIAGIRPLSILLLVIGMIFIPFAVVTYRQLMASIIGCGDLAWLIYNQHILALFVTLTVLFFVLAIMFNQKKK